MAGRTKGEENLVESPNASVSPGGRGDTVRLSQDWAGLLRVYGHTTSHGSNPTEPLIGGNEHTDLPELAQMKSDRQLQGIQRSKTFGGSILNQ